MSVQDEINRIAAAKADIASALEEKGVSVAEGTSLDEMGDMVRSIPSGGEANVIESVSVNSVALPITNKNVNIDLSNYMYLNPNTLSFTQVYLTLDFLNSAIVSSDSLTLQGLSAHLKGANGSSVVCTSDGSVELYGYTVVIEGITTITGDTNIEGTLSINGELAATQAYAEACASSIGTAANNYTDSKVSDAKAYADTVAGNALTSANSYTDSEISSVWEKIYPVGAIYISTKSTSPASLFGGSWATITNRFLLAQGSSYAAGSTNGSQTHTHTLGAGYAKGYLGTLASYGNYYGMAINQKSVSAYAATRATNGKSHNIPIDYSYSDTAVTTGISLGGSTDSASNLPPYQAVYMWQRLS